MCVMQSRALVEDGTSISSTLIRSCLLAGDIKKANAYLGYSYYLSGRVVDGKKVGRTLGGFLQPTFSHCVLKSFCRQRECMRFMYI